MKQKYKQRERERDREREGRSTAKTTTTTNDFLPGHPSRAGNGYNLSNVAGARNRLSRTN